MKFTLLLILLVCLVISTSFIANNNDPIKPFIVVLDAGHGGKDPGNLGNGFKEKDIVLDVTLQIGRILEKEPDFKILYTRTTDVFIELKDRAPVANRADADVFVSIHCNSHNSQANGAETFVMGLSKSNQNLNTAKKENEVIFLEENYEEKYSGFNPSAPESLIGLTLMQEEYMDQSIMLAGLVQSNIVNNLKRNDRSVKQDVFWVLHSSYMPSILVELGFLTHKSEGVYVNSAQGRKELAREIANGIITYKNSLQHLTNNTEPPIIIQKDLEKSEEITEINIYQGITFKVQLAASSKKLDTKPFNFKGLKEISRIKEDNLFKYYYGETSDYNKIKSMKSMAVQKGYSSCFIVAFKNGKKQKLADVLKSEDN